MHKTETSGRLHFHDLLFTMCLSLYENKGKRSEEAFLVPSLRKLLVVRKVDTERKEGEGKKKGKTSFACSCLKLMQIACCLFNAFLSCLTL